MFAPSAYSIKYASGLERPLKGVYPANSSFYQAHLTAADIDRDGIDEILVGNLNGQLYCFNPSAGLKWNFYAGAPIQGAPACHDVDGDGYMEVWVGDLNGRVWGLDCRGNVLGHWGWPKMTPNAYGYVGVFSSPSIGDVNGDGSSDIVVGTYGHTVECWSYYGAGLPGFPYNNKDTIWSSPALADLDYDGLTEVIIGADSTGGSGWPYPPGGLLYAFRHNGSIFPGFPKISPEVIWSSPSVADVNGDGLYEIFVGTGHYYKATGRISTEGHRVYGFRHDGSELPGWPVVTMASVFSSPAIGDIDGDGIREIVVACNPVNGIGEDGIMAFKPDGRVALAIRGVGGPMMGSPVLGDVNGDGNPDIIAGCGIEIRAWDFQGRVLWNQVMNNFVVTTPVVGDFDRDGRVEVAFGTGDRPGGSIPGGAYYVFDLGPVNWGKGKKAKLFPWPMFRRDPKHSATIRTGLEPPPAPPVVAPSNFNEYLLVCNPSEKTNRVDITFMDEQGNEVSTWRYLRPHSRETVWVNRYVYGKGVSASVKGREPIIAERSIYFKYGGRWDGGSCSPGVTKPSSKWYLAEGYLSDDFDTYLLIQNPNDSEARVTVDFLREGYTPVIKDFFIPPRSRYTINYRAIGGLFGKSVSAVVDSDEKIVCERSMYFNYGGKKGGHNSPGVTTLSKKWYFAEGYTAGDFDTYLLLANPNPYSAKVKIRFLRSDGFVEVVLVRLEPRKRFTFRVDDMTNFASAEFSIEIDSDLAVAAERSVYFVTAERDGGHETVGLSSLSKQFYFAEGYSAGSFDTFLLVMNPHSNSINVRTEFLRSDGYMISREDVIPPNARFTIHADAVAGLDSAEFSTRMLSISGAPFAAERAMYFAYGSAVGGHSAIGIQAPSRSWYFAEGYTGN